VPVIDLSFALKGPTIPLDYGYSLFSALSRIVPGLHGDRRVGVHPIRGLRLEPRRLTLVPQSRLRLRLPSEEVASYLPLIGAEIDLDGCRLIVGVTAERPDQGSGRRLIEPIRVEPLRPSASLASRLVTIGHLIEPKPFEESVRRQLASFGVAAEPAFIPEAAPARAGCPTRRVLRIKGRRIVGYALRIDGLTAEESLIVQENGLGSRRRMGCGVFVAERGSRSNG
jgi:CRISPR-associated protein Cas6